MDPSIPKDHDEQSNNEESTPNDVVLHVQVTGLELEIDENTMDHDNYSDDDSSIEEPLNLSRFRNSRNCRAQSEPRYAIAQSSRKSDGDEVCAVPEVLDCPIPGCQKSYRSFNGLKYHIMRHHSVPDTEYSCIYCGKEYKAYGHLKNHIHRHQQQKLKGAKKDDGHTSHRL